MLTAIDLANKTQVAIEKAKRILVNDFEERVLEAAVGCKFEYEVDISRFSKATGLHRDTVIEVVNEFCANRELDIYHDKEGNLTMSWAHVVSRQK